MLYQVREKISIGGIYGRPQMVTAKSAAAAAQAFADSHGYVSPTQYMQHVWRVAVPRGGRIYYHYLVVERVIKVEQTAKA